MTDFYPELRSACQCYPAIGRLADICAIQQPIVVDNHAHPILTEEHRDRFAFEGLISEANGSALIVDAVNTIACLRVVPELASILKTNPTWTAVKETRSKMDYQELCDMFMNPTVTGIQCMLLDDGLGGVEEFAQDYAMHDKFATSPTKRVVRVEIVAEGILKPLFKPFLKELSFDAARVLESFNSSFKASVTDSANDGHVAGFKSIACYRTGLDVSTADSMESIMKSLEDVLTMYRETGTLRLAHKVFNDHIVRMTLEISGECGKPVQFHTGLGDNDITLNRSSPAHLQPVIKAFPKTPFVLLHSSYPFTREAGYLTAVYPNVYLDFGEVFPFVSGAGQRSIIRQVLELSPTNKILWSTDGHWWPESYYLGSIQARQALYTVLSETVASGELLEKDAIAIVQNSLFHNANKLYNLSLDPDLDICKRK